MAVGLSTGKIQELSTRKKAMVLFAIGMFVGISVPLMAGIGNSSASAAPNATSQSVIGQSATVTNEGAAVVYTYQRLSATEAYPFYTTAAFTVAGGLFIYALTYVPIRSRARARSQYASRVATWAKTTY